MSKRMRLGMFLVALTLANAAQVSRVGAQLGAAARTDRGLTGMSVVAQGMMGQGMTGQGMMGPGMMQPPRPTEPGAVGNAIFQSQCSQCHTLQEGSLGLPGPSLKGVFGRKAGTAPGYSYSKAMQDSVVVWNDKTLDQYIAAPQGFIPGNAMPYLGITDKTTRRRLLAYVKEATR